MTTYQELVGKNTLYSVDEARGLLDSNVTSTITLDDHTKAGFDAPAQWTTDFSMAEDDENVGASLTIGGHEYDFTKEALLDFTSKFHLNKKYVGLLPPSYLVPQMNYWLIENETPIRLLVNGDNIIGVAKSASPFAFVS